jgi:hypothetical protein
MVSYNGMDDGVDVHVAEYYIQLFRLRAMSDGMEWVDG